ncbi:hypothetical protein D3879_14565 [Pseudomonas cavernicola]|uniref:Uncharacterized protein n=1 Tax=Pseudomonas cavernicola TaxID=2320866 RepID=A0A418XEE0_9PSED|nr:hypothetical protein [Pseudomonas cavernicola]RJG10901.1 hypothetical protein D3879_14565 [Pseudomonas cavernicola]
MIKLNPERYCAHRLAGHTLSRMMAVDDPAVYQPHRFGTWQPIGDLSAPSVPGESLMGLEPDREIRVCERCGYIEHRNQ